MTTQDNNNFEAAAKDQAVAPASPDGATSAGRKQELLASFWLSLVIAFLLCAANWWVDERTDFGKRIDEMTYGTLQHYLSSSAARENSQIVVLDISAIPLVPAKGFHEENITDRGSLLKIIQLLANVDPRPLGIGLDVDFSPDARGYADTADPGLFDSFLALEQSRSIPIRVGVHRSVDLGPGRWLRDPKYASLAACVVVPKPEKGQSTRYMPEWIDVGYSAEVYEGMTERCPILGITLAQLSALSTPRWPTWLLASTRQQTFQADPEHGARLVSNEVLVDYSPLDFLTNARAIRLSDDGEKLELLQSNGDDAQTGNTVVDGNISRVVGNKLVFLGRTKNATDTFIVPGRPEMPYAGVFLHACAAYTLLNGTLYTLAGPVRLLADLLLSLAIFGIVFWFRSRNRSERYEPFFERHLPVLLAAAAAAIIILGETWLLPRTRLMWDDFILVILVLLVHSPIEHAADGVVAWRRGPVRLQPRVSTPPSPPHSENEL
jgi:hypothetical protein